MDYILDQMQISNDMRRFNERVFLTRNKTAARTIMNMPEIAKVLRQFEFQIVDTAGMSIDDQIDVFSKTRYLVAIHGAGLTNIIFRRDAPLSVLELCPTSWKT